MTPPRSLPRQRQPPTVPPHPPLKLTGFFYNLFPAFTGTWGGVTPPDTGASGMEVSQGPPPMRGDPLESPELNWGGVPIGVCSRHWESAAVLPCRRPPHGDGNHPKDPGDPHGALNPCRGPWGGSYRAAQRDPSTARTPFPRCSPSLGPPLGHHPGAKHGSSGRPHVPVPPAVPSPARGAQRLRLPGAGAGARGMEASLAAGDEFGGGGFEVSSGCAQPRQTFTSLAGMRSCELAARVTHD